MREKEFYSKLCVAAGLSFVVGEERDKDINLTVNDKLSRNIATILARDKEVVAVRLIVQNKKCTILLSKNDEWLEKDKAYMRRIERYLKNLAEHPFQGNELESRDVQAFHRDVMEYCSSKLQTRFKKLKRDITVNPQDKYISQFVKFASIDVNNINMDKMSLFRMSVTCYEFCQKFCQSTEAKFNFPKIFLEHLKKVGSYHGSIKDIFDPDFDVKYIFSWSNIIKRFIPDPKKYEDFKETRLKDPLTEDRLRSIYGVNEDEILLDFENVEQQVCLHTEMKLVVDIIKRNNTRKTFIAVSKRCCYLCELYIEFANNNGYNIIIPGKHKKIYHSWKLPNIEGNSDFNEKAVSYLIEKLDRVIMDEIKQHRDFTQRSKSGNTYEEYTYEEYINFYTLKM